MVLCKPTTSELTPTLKDPGRYVIDVLKPEIKTVFESLILWLGVMFAETWVGLSHVKTTFSYRSWVVSIVETPIPINSETTAFNPVPLVSELSKLV